MRTLPHHCDGHCSSGSIFIKLKSNDYDKEYGIS